MTLVEAIVPDCCFQAAAAPAVMLTRDAAVSLCLVCLAAGWMTSSTSGHRDRTNSSTSGRTEDRRARDREPMTNSTKKRREISRFVQN